MDANVSLERNGQNSGNRWGHAAHGQASNRIIKRTKSKLIRVLVTTMKLCALTFGLLKHPI
jgi:hypothetical protein